MGAKTIKINAIYPEVEITFRDIGEIREYCFKTKLRMRSNKGWCFLHIVQYYGVKVSDVISDTLLEFSNDYHERVYIYQHCYVVPKNIAQLNFIEKDLDQISEQERLEILMK